MDKSEKYSINLNIRYGHEELIDIPEIIAKTQEKWHNQTLTKVNDSVVRIGIVQGEFHWHQHDNDDEFFLVLDGNLLIDLENQTFSLTKYQGLTISKGVLHRTRAPQKTVMLMIETGAIRPTGDENRK